MGQLILFSTSYPQSQLPDALRIITVEDGFVLLRAEGLYEAKLTLSPILDVPEAPSIYGPRGRGGASGNVGASLPAATIVGPGNVDEDEDGVTSGPKPKRWLWLMLSFKLLPNSCLRQPLAEPQMLHLLQDLNMRMSLSTDAAAYEKMRAARAEKSASATAAAGRDAIDMMDVDGAGPLEPSHSAMPAASAMTAGRAISAMTGEGSGVTGVVAMSSRAQLRSNLEELKRHAADEATLPLLTAHFILTEISTRSVVVSNCLSLPFGSYMNFAVNQHWHCSCRLLIDAAVTAINSLSSKGGRWEGGHLSVKLSYTLRPGLRVSYWLKSVPLVRLLKQEGDKSQADDGPEGGTSSTTPAALSSVEQPSRPKVRDGGEDQRQEGGYHVEIGISEMKGAGEMVVVRHLPQLPPIELRAGDDLPRWSQQEAGAASATASLSVLCSGEGIGGRVDKSGVAGRILGRGRGSGWDAEVTVLPPEPAVASELTPLGPPELLLDSAFVNVDEILLRSASHLAAIELSALRKELERHLAEEASSTLSPVGGAASLCSVRMAFVQVPWTRRQVSSATQDAVASAAAECESLPAAAGAATTPAEGSRDGDGSGCDPGALITMVGGRVLLPCPQLELRVAGRLYLRVTRNLFTGRLMLLPGQGVWSTFKLEYVQQEMAVGW